MAINAGDIEPFFDPVTFLPELPPSTGFSFGVSAGALVGGEVVFLVGLLVTVVVPVVGGETDGDLAVVGDLTAGLGVVLVVPVVGVLGAAVGVLPPLTGSLVTGVDVGVVTGVSVVP